MAFRWRRPDVRCALGFCYAPPLRPTSRCRTRRLRKLNSRLLCQGQVWNLDATLNSPLRRRIEQPPPDAANPFGAGRVGRQMADLKHRVKKTSCVPILPVGRNIRCVSSEFPSSVARVRLFTSANYEIRRITSVTFLIRNIFIKNFTRFSFGIYSQTYIPPGILSV